jgi:hypothetical protein
METLDQFFSTHLCWEVETPARLRVLDNTVELQHTFVD